VGFRFLPLLIAFGGATLGQTQTSELEKALTLFNSGRFRESLDVVSAYTRSHPNSSAGHKILGMDEFMLGNASRAIADLKYATELNPSDGDAYYYLGRLYFSADNARDALAAFKRALEIDPSSVRAHNHLGQTYEALGRITEAEGAYKQAIELERKQSKKSEWPYYNLGLVYLNDGRPDEATSLFRQALDRNSALTEAKVNLAKALAQTKQTDAALMLLNDAVRTDPKNAQAHYQLALLLLKSGKPEEAERHFALFERYRTR